MDDLDLDDLDLDDLDLDDLDLDFDDLDLDFDLDLDLTRRARAEPRLNKNCLLSAKFFGNAYLLFTQNNPLHSLQHG